MIKKLLLLSILFLTKSWSIEAAEGTSIDGLNAGCSQMIDGHLQLFEKYNLFDGTRQDIHFVQKDVRILGGSDLIKNRINDSVYNPKMRSLIHDPERKIQRLDQCPDGNLLNKNQIGGIAGGVTALFIANTVFDYCLSKLSGRLDQWILRKISNIKPETKAYRRCLNAISLTSRVLFTVPVGVIGYVLMYRTLEKQRY